MSDRWIVATNSIGQSPEVDAFITDILRACAKHRLSLSTSAPVNYAFLVQDYDEDLNTWLARAEDGRDT